MRKIFSIFAVFFVCLSSLIFVWPKNIDFGQKQNTFAVSDVIPFDTVDSSGYSFSGSYFPLATYCDVQTGFSGFPRFTYCLFRLDLSSTTLSVYSILPASSNTGLASNSYGSSSLNVSIVFDTWSAIFLNYTNGVNNRVAISTWYYCDSGFNANVSSITISLLDNYFGDTTVCSQLINYYDVNGKVFRFGVRGPGPINEYRNNYLPERTYYLSPDLSDNDIYNQGFSTGYQDGLLNGEQSGYNSGYTAGNSAGYQNGYNAGVNDSNNYSFYNLFGSVIDAPVQTFIGLLNFNLFGVNLLSVCTGLLTLSLIILIVRLIKGG